MTSQVLSCDVVRKFVPPRMAKRELPEAKYTDEQVIGATGLPIDSLRRLITWGAVSPAQAGGGRGRVRLWTTRQALRISLTAQFSAAGFSLQMAHTLAYCIPPLGGLLTLYDPETLVQIYAEKDIAHLELPEKGVALDILTKPGEPIEWPIPGEFWGSETLIFDRKFLYTDAWGDGPEIVAEIDSERQRVIPFYDPTKIASLDKVIDKFTPNDAHTIDKSSLLIDRKYLSAAGRAKLVADKLPVNGKITGKVVCRSLLSINLALGFVLCVRQLRGVPSEYEYPIEYEPANEES